MLCERFKGLLGSSSVILSIFVPASPCGQSTADPFQSTRPVPYALSTLKSQHCPQQLSFNASPSVEGFRKPTALHHSMSFSPYVSLGTYSRDHSCGYCGRDDTAQSFGFVAPLMTVEIYEAMLSRGWRRSKNPFHLRNLLIIRSGRYMYKHNLRNTCCRLYPVVPKFGWVVC